MFRSQLFDHLQGGPSFVLSAVTTSLLVCVVKLSIWHVAVCFNGVFYKLFNNLVF